MQVTFMFQDKLKAKRESIKQENCIKVILILEIKLEKYIFMQNMTIFLASIAPFFIVRMGFYAIIIRMS